MMNVTLTPTLPEHTGIMESPITQEGEVEPGQDSLQKYERERPPPLHTGADWKIILHLPEIDTWIRSTSERVRQLTQSVQEDPQSRHVDVHLMQLKEICEDISDHVEQIHALLDTEFSLKLLSYSVNVIVDIHTVQLLWHQLRVSVLVLRERILQGLQDSNGNYTRQTDILQAFTQENQEERLDALTEVDCSGQLTIRCPTDYLSLDCGITAYELSDYSPRDEEPHMLPAKPLQAWTYSAMQQEFPDLVKGPGLLSVVPQCQDQPVTLEMENERMLTNADEPVQQPPRALPLAESTTPKRPLQDSSDHGGDSPTRPSLPKKGLFLREADNWAQTELSSSLPEYPSSPRKHLTLTLTPPYSSNASTNFNLPVKIEDGTVETNLNSKNSETPNPPCLGDRTTPSMTSPPQKAQNVNTGNELEDHRSPNSPTKDIDTGSWYGSDEFLALPSHLHQTEVLALHLGSLSQLVSPAPEDDHPPLRDVEDWEISSGSEIGPSSPRCLSPSTPSDLAPYLTSSGLSTPQLSGSASSRRQNRAELIQKLMWDIQRQDNDRHVWDRIQGFVSKLGRFINWLQDAMEATENWTPPQPETEALQLYLHTHLNFKQSVDGHCDLKDAVMDEGHRLMEVLVSHRPGFQEMLQMITAQWKELQMQIRRQHGWILSALDTIKTEVLQPEEENESQLNGSPSSLEAQREAVSRMSLQLSSTQSHQHSQPPEVTPVKCNLRKQSVQELEAECQDIWDWLLDMDATVHNSLGLMVSEDQHLQMCKRCSVEISLREDRVEALLNQTEAMKQEGSPLPDSVLEKEGLIREKWEMLKKSLTEALTGSSAQVVLSPGSGSLLQQLDQRVKELKSWLRDTELTLYNSSLKLNGEGDGKAQKRLQRELQRFQALCSELRLRQRGVMSVLRLCHHLLSFQEQSPQQDSPSLQLLCVNLERRWEAIVMQSTQWQRSLQRELGSEQEMDFFVDPDWADLSSSGIEEALEWDETDIKVESDDNQDPEHPAVESFADHRQSCSDQALSENLQSQTHVYQVYSLHNVELFGTDAESSLVKDLKLGILPSLFQGCTFSSLPDLASGSHPTHSFHPHKTKGGSSGHSESESGIASGGEAVTAANSEGCLSLDGEGLQELHGKSTDVRQRDDTEDGHTNYSRTKQFIPCTFYDYSTLQADRFKVGVMDKTQRIIPSFAFSKHTGQVSVNRTVLPSSSKDHSPEDAIDFQELIEVLSSQDSPSSSSSLESLSVTCEGLESTALRRSVSLESWPASYKSNEDLFSQQGSADVSPGSEPGEELSKRTLDLLKRLEDIECPSEQKMKRSLSDDITVRSSSHEPSLAGFQSPQDRVSSGNEDLGSELTELSSSEELSLRSEDLAVLKGRLLGSNACFRKHLSRSLCGEEGEANLSMIVNVSCTSACTDEEDDSDLLSSSTLTLTEEEEEEEEEDDLEVPNYSMGSEDDAADDTELPLGSDFIRRELQAWIRPSFFLPKERKKISRLVQDMTKASTDEQASQSSLNRQCENNGNGNNMCKNLARTVQEGTRVTTTDLVDDVENGNISSRVDSVKNCVIKIIPLEKEIKPRPLPLISITKTERLHPPSMPALAYHKPRELDSSFNGKSSLRVTRDALADVDMPDSIPSAQTKETSCSCHTSPHEKTKNAECDVHEFVKEILDMASTALHGSSPQEAAGHGTGSQLKEKVLEHSRRQHERGDFISYLSLSSHDSDCGELNGFIRASTPQMPEEEGGVGNIEGMFEPSTEDKPEEVADSSYFLKGSISVASKKTQKTTESLKVKTSHTGIKSFHNKTQNLVHQTAAKNSAFKLQGHSKTTKGASPKTSKTLPASRDLNSEPTGKNSAKQTASSLPILHKRRSGVSTVKAIEHEKEKKLPQGPKNYKDL
ncbi:hypothetical protein GDO86_016312 [Hymenochirus boettgeri]|uniref:A-kinase anchor protein 6 n=1 Tax=Hymenochirus boettgeri TaxID=247094 RepID=A0A8T2K1K0_9PIPI|nr:hypothetical protein GDO86_016312 [Hymenochirus boettgeri]